MILQPPAEPGHTVLLRSDGRAVACGVNSYDQCTLPTLDAGVRYAQASAGDYRTVFLCSDGIAVACGGDTHGQYELLALDEGMTYVQVSAASQVDFPVFALCRLLVQSQCCDPRQHVMSQVSTVFVSNSQAARHGPKREMDKIGCNMI
mmetsp:Transcript_168365/g.540930  ORF Transcript_168365/g.540930 Transcript_168365/m.540930 type:complete len:148 (+) Transcript_168365:106-549(+)